MQQAAFDKILQLDAVMLFAVFGSGRSACWPSSTPGAQITVRIDLWTDCLEVSHWIVDLMKPVIKVNINSSKLLFGGRRESALRAAAKGAPSTPVRLG